MLLTWSPLGLHLFSIGHPLPCINFWHLRILTSWIIALPCFWCEGEADLSSKDSGGSAGWILLAFPACRLCKLIKPKMPKRRSFPAFTEPRLSTRDTKVASFCVKFSKALWNPFYALCNFAGSTAPWPCSWVHGTSWTASQGGLDLFHLNSSILQPK